MRLVNDIYHYFVATEINLTTGASNKHILYHKSNDVILRDFFYVLYYLIALCAL
jgi:hypothetical protein